MVLGSFYFIFEKGTRRIQKTLFRKERKKQQKENTSDERTTIKKNKTNEFSPVNTATHCNIKKTYICIYI
jgi:hypothetical protein